MKIKLDCKNAAHDKEMRVICRATGGLCAHQYFKSCKGWWTTSPQALTCPLRDKTGGDKR